MLYYTRALSYSLPLIRGTDVLEVQKRLKAFGFDVGKPDGLFGRLTEKAVRSYQESRNLTDDGIIGPVTWDALFKETTLSTDDKPETSDADDETPTEDQLSKTFNEKINSVWPELTDFHSYRDSIHWKLTPRGLIIREDNGDRRTTGGSGPQTVRRVWSQFGESIGKWASYFSVPIELIIATICTESSGKPKTIRHEPGYTSDEETPSRVSPGLMQTLLSTARETLGGETLGKEKITVEWLFDPDNSIRAGTAYIARQWKRTHLDPPKVACAYNAGGVYHNDSELNRWKMRQYPINTDHHANRFVLWFNDCFWMFEEDKQEDTSFSFFRLLEKTKAGSDSATVEA